MIKKILGNLWFWVVLAFLLIISRWVWAINVAGNYDFSPVTADEKIERVEPTPIKGDD